MRVLGINTPFKGITITKTGGQHGTDEMFSNPTIAENFGESMGFVLRAPGQKTVYFAGDTILHDYVELALKKYKPDIIINPILNKSIKINKFFRDIWSNVLYKIKNKYIKIKEKKDYSSKYLNIFYNYKV